MASSRVIYNLACNKLERRVDNSHIRVEYDQVQGQGCQFGQRQLISSHLKHYHPTSRRRLCLRTPQRATFADMPANIVFTMVISFRTTHPANIEPDDITYIQRVTNTPIVIIHLSITLLQNIFVTSESSKNADIDKRL